MKIKLLIAFYSALLFTAKPASADYWNVGNYSMSSPLTPFSSFYNPAIYNDNFFYFIKGYNTYWANQMLQDYSYGGTRGLSYGLINAAYSLVGWR